MAVHRQELARGILLLSVFYMHALFLLVEHIGGAASAPIGWSQNRLFAAQVALFFVLAGQTAKDIGSRGAPVALTRSLTLLILGAISHVPAAILFDLFQEEALTLEQLARDVAKPIVLGTGYWTSIPWFFVVLASTRLLAYAFQRSKLWFAFWLMVVAAAAWAGDRLGLTSNLYEWRNLPVALPFFLIGMYLPAGWSPPRWLAIVSAIGLPVTALTNSAAGRPCFNCDSVFVAQPFVGQMGFPPLVYLNVAFGYCLLAYVAAAMAGSRLGRVIRPFGKHSLLLLLMHGWLIVSLYQFVVDLLPKQENVGLYIVFAVLIPAVHWLLFMVLRRPLSTCYNLAVRLSRTIVNTGVRLSRASIRTRKTPAATS